jgi:hypothetical protein
VRAYLSSARRYRWCLLAILALVWGAGLIAAYVEYKTTFEARATIWVVRASSDLTAPNPDDPSIPLVQTAASQQVDLLNQLLLTRSFVTDVVSRTSLGPTLAAAEKPGAILDDVRKHFKVAPLGTNMLSVSYAGRDPVVAAELVKAALDVRGERLAQTRIQATTALSALYQRQFELAQARVSDSRQKLEDFNNSHPAPLSELDQHQLAQLRLTLDFAQVGVSDLQGRMDRAVLAPTLLDISGVEFQVVDQPRAETSPSGGAKPALSLALVAFGCGAALAALLIIAGAFLANRVGEPEDVEGLAPATHFASVPRVATKGQAKDLRSSLAAIAFGDGHRAPGEERA